MQHVRNPFWLFQLLLQAKKIPLQVEHRFIITDNDYQLVMLLVPEFAETESMSKFVGISGEAIMRNSSIRMNQFTILLTVLALFSTACGNSPHQGAHSANTDSQAVEGGTESGHNGSQHYPVTLQIYTDEGKEMKQTIEKEPQKVVVLGTAMAELMIQFGQKDKIAGLAYLDQSFSPYTDEIAKLPLLTELWPSKEAVIALQPDLIYSMSSAFKEDRLGGISFWNERGIQVVPASNFNIGRSIVNYFEDIQNFGKIFNVEEQTDSYLKQQQTRIDEITQKAQQVKAKPKVLLLASAGRENYDYYPPSWCVIDEMVEGSGGEYIQLADGYIELQIEAIIAANPDKIILTHFQESDHESIKNKLLSNPRLKNMKAIQTGNVMVADYTNAIRGGLQLTDLYEEVARFVQPELFGGQ